MLGCRATEHLDIGDTMTIRYTGHVQKLEVFDTDVLVVLQMAEHSQIGEIVVRCPPETAKLYMPGTSVQLQIYPIPEAKT